MKKIFTLIVFSFFVSYSAVQAQVEFGIRAGLNSSNWKGDAAGSIGNLAGLTNGYITTGNRTGVFAGGFVHIPVSGILSIEPGAFYSQKGFTLRGNIDLDKLDFLGLAASAQVQSHYIDIPVLVKAELAEGLEVFVGPQVSILAHNNLRLRAGALGINMVRENIDITNQFNTTDFSLIGGVSYTLPNGVSVSGAYDHGLSRLDNSGMFNVYNRGFRVGLGFRF